MLLFGVLGWTVILTTIMPEFLTKKFCGTRLGVWHLFGAKYMMF